MTAVLGGFKKYIAMCRRYQKWATQKYFKVHVGKCFMAWSDWNYMVSQGLDRKRWPGPRKYEVRHYVWLIEYII